MCKPFFSFEIQLHHTSHSLSLPILHEGGGFRDCAPLSLTIGPTAAPQEPRQTSSLQCHPYLPSPHLTQPLAGALPILHEGGGFRACAPLSLTISRTVVPYIYNKLPTKSLTTTKHLYHEYL